MNSGYLPFDVITGVLCRLPVKTLIRFKSVSKQWHSLVEDPYFIKSHLERSQNSLILRKSHSGTKLYLVGMDSLELITEFGDLPWFRDSWVKECSCNGLIIFCCHPHGTKQRGGEETIICWNFATREHHMIPPPYSYMPYLDWSPMGFYNYTYSKRWPTMVLHNDRRGYGFGYDSLSDDYKLILIDNTLELGYISIVYSMKRNHWDWSRISLGLDLFMLEARGFFVKGYLNWGAGGNIVAFALDTEEFCQVPLPKGIKSLALMNVGILGGCLMMTHANISESKRNVWVMKDYMVRESWTKLYVLPSVSIKVIGQISSDELLLREDGWMIGNKLCRNDIVIGAMKEARIKGLVDWCKFSDELVFVGSLIPINKLFGGRRKLAITQGKEEKFSLSLTYLIIMLLLFIVACFVAFFLSFNMM